MSGPQAVSGEPVSPEALEPAVAGDDASIESPAGVVRMRSAGTGPPVLLVHSINAAASAAEVAPVHAGLTDRYRVHTPDLPGFGRSDRPAVHYTPSLYVDALSAVVEHVAREDAAPIHGLGLSLGGELLARTVEALPTRFASLTLATPTGFDARSARSTGERGSTREVAWLRRFLARERVGAGAFSLLSRDRVIRYFLGRTLGGDPIDPALLAYACRTVRVDGARHAPLSFLSGSLFGRDARALYESLTLPVWLAHGTRGDFSDFSGADWVAERDAWQRTRFATGAIPWFPKQGPFLDALRTFLAGGDVPSTA